MLFVERVLHVPEELGAAIVLASLGIAAHPAAAGSAAPPAWRPIVRPQETHAPRIAAAPADSAIRMREIVSW
jgi:hypothetical protein